MDGANGQDTVRVRWIGQRRLYSHRTDADGYGIYDTDGSPVLDYDEAWERIREVPWVGLADRWLYRRELPGLSRDYHFGPKPGTFTVEMTVSDWTIVQRAWEGAVRLLDNGRSVPVPLPFAVVGVDDDGGRISTAKQHRGTDPVLPDVIELVEAERQRREASGLPV